MSLILWAVLVGSAVAGAVAGAVLGPTRHRALVMIGMSVMTVGILMRAAAPWLGGAGFAGGLGIVVVVHWLRPANRPTE